MNREDRVKKNLARLNKELRKLKAGDPIVMAERIADARFHRRRLLASLRVIRHYTSPSPPAAKRETTSPHTSPQED